MFELSAAILACSLGGLVHPDVGTPKVDLTEGTATSTALAYRPGAVGWTPQGMASYDQVRPARWHPWSAGQAASIGPDGSSRRVIDGDLWEFASFDVGVLWNESHHGILVDRGWRGDEALYEFALRAMQTPPADLSGPSVVIPLEITLDDDVARLPGQLETRSRRSPLWSMALAFLGIAGAIVVAGILLVRRPT